MRPVEQTIEGRVTIIVGADGMEIEISDHAAATMFVRLKLAPKDACAALGRLACVPCRIEVGGLDRVGKRMEMDAIVFQMPNNPQWRHSKQQAREIALDVCPDGWTPDLSFGSQNSFFSEDGKEYARTTIRRWVPVEKEEDET